MTVVRTDWRNTGIAVAFGIVSAFFIGKLPPAIPVLRESFDVGLVVSGWIVSVFNAVGMLSGAVLGFAADQLGQRRAVAVATAAMVAGALLGMAAPTVPFLLAGRFLEGFGYVLMGVSVPALIAATTAPEHRRVALSLWGFAVPAGMTITLVIAPPILEFAGWRALWGLTAVASGVLGLMLWRVAPPTRPSAGGGRRGMRLWATLSHPPLQALGLGFAAYTFQWTTLMVWLPSFFIQARGADGYEASLLTALVVAVNVPGNMAGGWLMHLGAPRAALIMAASVVMGLSGLGIFSHELGEGTRYLLCIAFSFFAGLLPSAAFASAPVHAASATDVAAANGMIMQGSNLGQFVGPPALAAMVAAAGGDWGAASGVLAVGALIAFACGAFIAFTEYRARAKPL